MAETKRPVGLLFDIGGVCVREILGPNTYNLVTNYTIGCIAIPSNPRLRDRPEYPTGMGQFQHLPNKAER
jgi:hypothetical protein